MVPEKPVVHKSGDAAKEYRIYPSGRIGERDYVCVFCHLAHDNATRPCTVSPTGNHRMVVDRPRRTA